MDPVSFQYEQARGTQNTTATRRRPSLFLVDGKIYERYIPQGDSSPQHKEVTMTKDWISVGCTDVSSEVLLKLAMKYRELFPVPPSEPIKIETL